MQNVCVGAAWGSLVLRYIISMLMPPWPTSQDHRSSNELVNYSRFMVLSSNSSRPSNVQQKFSHFVNDPQSEVKCPLCSDISMQYITDGNIVIFFFFFFQWWGNHNLKTTMYMFYESVVFRFLQKSIIQTILSATMAYGPIVFFFLFVYISNFLFPTSKLRDWGEGFKVPSKVWFYISTLTKEPPMT